MKTDFNTGSDLNVNFNSSSSWNSQFGANNNSIGIETDSEHEIEMTFSSTTSWNALFDNGSSGGGESKVLYASTEYWNSHPEIIAKRGYIYIYSNWMYDEQGNLIAGFKVGDGDTPLIELSVTDQMFADHVNDAVRHITQAERERWNNKVTCDYVEQLERIIFSK